MKSVINVCRVEREIAFDDFANEIWQKVEPVLLSKYWSGADAPPERRAAARLVWMNEALLVRFDCEQFEPFVAEKKPDVTRKTIGLWERDVCEIFVAPDAAKPENYFEFEAAPTGEWIDLAVRQLPTKRETDFDYESKMQTAAQIAENSFAIILRVEWHAFGRKPEFGDRWRANLFRCVGSGETRGYLAWQPTLTETANFHVPNAFGWLRFSK